MAKIRTIYQTFSNKLEKPSIIYIQNYKYIHFRVIKIHATLSLRSRCIPKAKFVFYR